MKPIAREGDYLVRKFDPNDNEIEMLTSEKGVVFVKAECEAWLDEVDPYRSTDPTKKLGYSYTINRVIVNSKYNRWAWKK
jgi:hypothetical protein